MVEHVTSIRGTETERHALLDDVADHLDLGARLCTPERRLGLREQTLAMFPTLASRMRQACRHAIGWRTTDAVDNSSTDDGPACASARRAVDGSRSQGRARGI